MKQEQQRKNPSPKFRRSTSDWARAIGLFIIHELSSPHAMPENSYPGVYVEETSFRSKVIEGVSTTTTGFVGPCRSGPIIAPPDVITSLAQFERTYGDGAQLEFITGRVPSDTATPMTNYLWHAARAFFAEGGKRLYIARAFRPLQGNYPPDFSKPENLYPEADPPRVLWADGHARAAFGEIEFRSRYPGAASNVIVRITASAGQNRLDQRPEIDSPNDVNNSIHGLTVSINIISADRKHDLGTWSGLSLDPLDQLGAGDSVFRVFRESSPSISERQIAPLVISSARHIAARDVFDQLFSNLLTVTADDEKIFGKNDTLAQKFAVGVTVEIPLLGGNDGIRPGASEYEGVEGAEATFKTGLKQFEDIDDISIVAAPGSTADFDQDRDEAHAVYEQLIRHATIMRWRIAVLDSPPDQGVADVRKVRAALDSSYAAFYYPWVTVHDPMTGQQLNLPPSGFVAGIYARNDVNRAVYKAPANEVVNLAIGFEQSLSKDQQEVLNPEGINCFRFFEGRGYRLWGARTISSEPEWKYVNLRRYFAYLEHSIDNGTRWAVFEPNGMPLWAVVRRTIEDFLLNEFQMGALLGEKPERAYFVKCDRSTMTQNDLDNGRLVALIGVAVSRPAEFVIFRIGQWTADHKANPPSKP
jgi:phage tail sheath protein FI